MTDFTLELDPLGAKNGWMDCWLVVDGQRHQLDATSVFSPFCNLLALARAIATNNFPYNFFWEEEGPYAEFQASLVAPDSPNFHLCIKHNGEIVMDTEFDRMQVLQGLLESLRGFALDCPGAESEWEFPYFLIENFERDLAQGFKMPTDITSVRTVNFIFSHYGGYGGRYSPAFSFWIDNKLSVFMDLDYIARHWQAWFEMLEKIRRRDMPVAVVFQREVGEEPDMFAVLAMETSHHFLAEALPDPQQFHLKVTVKMLDPETCDIILDAVFDRRQFVGAFTQAFKDFLKTDYLAFLNSEENKFDLRSLPLDRLTEI